MVEYNLDWLKEKGFFRKSIPLEVKEKRILVDDLFAYVEVSSNEEIEGIKRELLSQKIRYIWFFFPGTGKLKVFRRIGEVKWFYYSDGIKRKEFKKSRIDKLNKFSPNNMNILFDIRDIVEKFYWQLWEHRVLMARSIKELEEDKNKLLVVQHLIDRLVFFYFLAQLKLVKVKNKEREWVLDRKNTREFFKWICSQLSESNLQKFLNKIFFDVLGQVKESGFISEEFVIRKERFSIVSPCLNGGLFIEEKIEGIPEGKIKISGIKKLILEVLNNYNWIIGEEFPEEEDVIGDLTPEIIGHIYEKFVVSLEQIGLGKIKLKDVQTVKEELRYGRKKIGAYYTPEEITNYISMNTIYPCIRDKLKEKFGKDGEVLLDNLFKKDNFNKQELEIVKRLYFEILTKIKICDNACGSGSFLIAAGDVLLRLYSRILKILEDNLSDDRDVKEVLSNIRKSPTRNYYIVRQIIVSNLYGVDIMEGAVEIAKLRFWLWLISQVDPRRVERRIETLPNLDFNLMVGNSLIGFVDMGDVKFDFASVEPKERWDALTSKQYLITTWTDKDKVKWLKELAKQKQKFKTLPAHEAIKLKEELNKDLEKAREFLNEKFYSMLKSNGIKISEEEFRDLKPFHWGFEFYEAFDLEKPKEGRGFNVIIGNPPYGNIFGDQELQIIQKIFPFSSSSKDSSAIFIERSKELLLQRGKFGMIVPLNIARIEKFYNVRKFLIDEVSTYLILDSGNPFAGDVELEMIVIFYDFKKRDRFFVRSLKPVIASKNGIPYQLIRKYGYRFILYWDNIYKTILKSSILGWLEVSQGVPRRADYATDGKYLCISAIAIDRYTINTSKIQQERKVTENFVKKKKLTNQLEEAIITPFSLGKTGKVTDLAFECIIKPKNYLPDGTTIFIKLKDKNITKKYALAILNSSLINYVTCRYILSYGVRIFRNYLFYMLPLRLLSTQQPFIILADYMLFLNATEERRTKEKELIDFIDKQIIDSLVYELYLGEVLYTPEDLVEFFKENKDLFDNIFEKIFQNTPSYRQWYRKNKEKVFSLISLTPDILKTISFESYEIVEEWIESSLKELERCKRDVNTKDYEGTLERLSLCIEKVIKAYALYFGLFKERELKNKVIHFPIRVYVNLLTKSWIGKILDFFNFKSDINKHIQFLKRLEKLENSSIMELDRDVSIFLNFHKQIYEKLKKGFEQRETKYLIETLKPYKDIENFYYVLFGFGSLLLPLSVVVSSYYRVTYPDKARELSLNLQELELIKNITIILQNLEENIKKFKLLIKEEKEKKHNPYLLLPSLIE